MNLRRISSLLFALALIGLVGMLIVGGSALRSEAVLIERQGELDGLEQRLDAFSARSDEILFDPLAESDLAIYVANARALQAELRTYRDVSAVGQSAIDSIDEMIVLAREHANLAPAGEADADARARRMAELGLSLDDAEVALSSAVRTNRIATHRRVLIALSIVSGAFATLTVTLAAFLRWRVSVPLTEIIRTAQRVSFGDADERVSGGRLPELQQMTAALNSALDRRDHAQRTLAEKNRELDRYASRLVYAQEIAHLGSFYADSPDGVMSVSDELLRIAGLDADTFVPTFETLAQVAEPDDRDVLHEARTTVWAGDDFGPRNVRVRRPTGEVRVVQIRARPSFDSVGQVQAIEGTVLDITDVSALERELQAERRLNEIGGRLARVGGWSVDASTMTPAWADMVSDIYETPTDYVPPIEQGISFYAPTSRPAIQAAFERLVNDGEPYDLEAQLDTAKGRRIWVRTVGQALRDARGNVIGYEGAIQDIDARKRSEEALEEERHMALMASELARVGGWSVDLTTDQLYWSDTVFDLHEVPRGETPSLEEAIGFFTPTSRPILQDAIDHLVNEGEPYDLELELDTAKGKRVWVRSVGRPRYDDRGNIVAEEGAMQDIDARKRSEEALDEERRMNLLASELAQVGGWSYDLGNDELTWSDSVFDLHEMPRGETPSFEEAVRFFAPADRLRINHAFDRLVNDGEPYDLEVQIDTARGNRIWIRAVGQPRYDAQGNVIAVDGAAQDIDARKRSEETLDEERRMSAMADRVARIGGWSIDFPTMRHDWSDMVYEIHGLPKDHTPSPDEGLAMYAPSSRPLIEEAFDRLLREGTPYDLELELDRADGRRIWVRTVARPVFDEQGKLTSVEGAFLDIDARKRSEEALEEERRMNAIASRLARVGGWSVDVATDAVTWSETVYDLFDLPSSVVPTLESVFGSFDAEDRAKMEAGYQRAARDGETYDVESQLIADTGKRLWIRTVGEPRFDDQGNVMSVEGAVQDIDARKQSEEALRKALAVQERLMSTIPAQVALLAADGTILEVNERWRQFGRENGMKDPSFGVGSNYLAVSRDARGREADVARTIAEGLDELLDGQRDVLSVEYPCHAPDQHRWFQLEARAVATEAKRRAVLMHVDVTDRHEAQERLEYLAFHDPLTGLLNRIGLSNQLSTLLEPAWLEEHVLVEIDLRDMSSVNDIHGFDAGDALLKSVAARLTKPSVGQPPDLLARTGGDEFVFLIGPDGADHKDEEGDRMGDRAVRAARVVLDEIVNTSHELSSTMSVKIDAHVGLTRLTSVPRAPEDLLREAQLALFEGRNIANVGWAEYSSQYEEEVRARRRLSDELQLAIERGELRLHFHPTVDTRTGKLSSAEALVRWQHPVRGLLPPGAFIPAAEQTGLIVPLGRWVLNEACRKMATWRSALRVTRIAVNASADELMQPSYTDDVLEALERHDVDPTMLTIEVTETALVRDPELAAKHLHALREAGVRLALDDFGTGYASLAILKNFPFEHVKIDRLFVSDMITDTYSHGVIDSVIALAKTIGATVIGEGVETEEQRRALVELGCEIAQGYYFCLPLAEEDFEWLLQTRPSLPLGGTSA